MLWVALSIQVCAETELRSETWLCCRLVGWQERCKFCSLRCWQFGFQSNLSNHSEGKRLTSLWLDCSNSGLPIRVLWGQPHWKTDSCVNFTRAGFGTVCRAGGVSKNLFLSLRLGHAMPWTDLCSKAKLSRDSLLDQLSLHETGWVTLSPWGLCEFHKGWLWSCLSGRWSF